MCIRAYWTNKAGVYSGFCSMKRLGIFLLPPGCDASPSQGYAQHLIRRYPFIHLGGERHCESKVSCPRTQHNVPRARLRTVCFGDEGTSHEATAPPTSTEDRLGICATLAYNCFDKNCSIKRKRQCLVAMSRD